MNDLAEKMQEWSRLPVWDQFQAGDLMAAVGVILAAIVLALSLVRLIRRHAGTLDDDDKKGGWALTLTALRKPAALAVCGYGLYFAALAATRGEDPSPQEAMIVEAVKTMAEAAGIVAIFWLVFRGIQAFEKLLKKWALKSEGLLDDILVPIVARALRLLLPVLAALALMPLFPLPEMAYAFLQKLLAIFVVGSVGYLIVRSVNTIQAALVRNNSIDAEDNLRARSIYTQISVLRKVIIVVTVVVTAGCILMLFDPVRQLGTSILASAGIAGVILGLAAQKTLGNLLAGIQIALTQPIRIDDVVIVDNEWGRIEEITLTYVVVRIWDLRRLVVPINFFIENTFQNWTRKSANVLATVFVFVDHSMPVQAVREEFERLLKANPLWDGQACTLQVTDCNRDTVELRCLGSASDASRAWNLRCELREALLAFLQEKYPQHLPRVRTAQLEGGAAAPASITD